MIVNLDQKAESDIDHENWSETKPKLLSCAIYFALCMIFFYGLPKVTVLDFWNVSLCFMQFPGVF